MISRPTMLGDLARLIGHGNVEAGLESALAFLQQYEGSVVCKLRPQYQRIRARELVMQGYSYTQIAGELDVSPRHVFNLLHN